jgi:polar amino acid transport system substrate-binding protein
VSPHRRAVLLVAVAALAAVSCSTGDGSGSATTEAPGGGGGQPVAAEVVTIAPGVLTVCADSTFEPFKFVTEDGQWSGFEMDLLTEIAAGTGGGLTLEVVEQPFDGIWRQPAAGVCDLVAAALTITEQRSTEALFSDPYYDSAQSMLVPVSDTAAVASLADVAGATVGVQTGTTGEAYARANAPAGTTVVAYDNGDELIAALAADEVDAVVQDLPLNLARVRQQPGRYRVAAQFLTGEQYGFAVASGNTALIDAVNAGLARLRSDGSYQTTYNRYFTTGS